MVLGNWQKFSCLLCDFVTPEASKISSSYPVSVLKRLSYTLIVTGQTPCCPARHSYSEKHLLCFSLSLTYGAATDLVTLYRLK